MKSEEVWGRGLRIATASDFGHWLRNDTWFWAKKYSPGWGWGCWFWGIKMAAGREGPVLGYYDFRGIARVILARGGISSDGTAVVSERIFSGGRSL